MPRLWPDDTLNRAVKNFKIHTEELLDKRCAVFVTALEGDVLETFIAPSREAAEAELRHRGYVRIATFTAFDLDNQLPTR